MAKFAHSDTLDQGPNLIKTSATKMLLISSYTVGDSYATVTANTLATVNMTSTDYTFSSSGNNRLLTVASGKSTTATASASGTPDLHIAFTDGTSRVLWVTDEASNVAISSGATINFPSNITYTTQQPT